MRRSALALWAAMTALALTAGPAAAQSAGEQTASGSTGSAQIASASLNARTRVASDGDDGPTAAQAPETGGSGDSPGTDGGAGPPGDADDGTGGGSDPDGGVLDEDGSGGGAPLAPIATVLGAEATSLPYTGLGLGLLFAIGGLLLAGGTAVRHGSGAIG